MLYLVIKALVSGALIAAASEVARRWPGIGGLIVSLQLPPATMSTKVSPAG